MKIKNGLGLLLAVWLSLSLGQRLQRVQADQTAAGFELALVDNDHQRDHSHAWYDLALAPGTSTTIAVKLHNTSNQQSSFNLKTGPAVTNSAMHMFLATETVPLQAQTAAGHNWGNPLQLSDSTVTLAPQEEKTISLTVKGPRSARSGSWLGGLQVQKVLATGAGAAGVANRFNYVSYVQVSPDQTVHQADLHLGQIRYQKRGQQGQLTLPVRNQAGGYLSQGKARLTIKQGQKTLAVVKQDQLAVANYSAFDYQVPVKALPPNHRYQLQATIWDGQGHQRWQQSSTFWLPGAQKKQGQGQHWLLFAVLLLALGLLCLLSALLWRRYLVMTETVLANGRVARERMTRRRLRLLKSAGLTIYDVHARHAKD
ncbi:DUF916 domain-containing protein [Leuconostocaceae bacterium ESL0958]|nr:DUF916 domain-containing protein [Leuconostocaceae bacterium ESL0958]